MFTIRIFFKLSLVCLIAGFISGIISFKNTINLDRTGFAYNYMWHRKICDDIWSKIQEYVRENNEYPQFLIDNPRIKFSEREVEMLNKNYYNELYVRYIYDKNTNRGELWLLHDPCDITTATVWPPSEKDIWLYFDIGGLSRSYYILQKIEENH